MSYIGTTNINKLAWNNTTYTKGYIGNRLLFGSTPPIPPTPTDANYNDIYYLGTIDNTITGNLVEYLWSGEVIYNQDHMLFKPYRTSLCAENKIDLTTEYVGMCSIATCLLKNGRYHAEYLIDSSPDRNGNVGYPSTSTKPITHAIDIETEETVAICFDSRYDTPIDTKATYNAYFSLRLEGQETQSRVNYAKVKTWTIFKADDLSSLINKCGLSNTTTPTILNNAADINKIFATETTIKEMLKLTGDFMFKAMANTTFINAYKNSQYKSVIDSNEHWGKFITLI